MKVVSESTECCCGSQSVFWRSLSYGNKGDSPSCSSSAETALLPSANHASQQSPAVQLEPRSLQHNHKILHSTTQNLSPENVKYHVVKEHYKELLVFIYFCRNLYWTEIFVPCT